MCNPKTSTKIFFHCLLYIDFWLKFCYYYHLITLKVSCPCFLASTVSDKKWAIILIFVPTYNCVFLPLAARFFSLSLIISSLTIMYPVWLSWHLSYLIVTELTGSPDWCFLTNLEKFWLFFLKIHFCPVLYLLSHWGSYYIYVWSVDIASQVTGSLYIFLNLFSFSALVWIISVDLCCYDESILCFIPSPSVCM